MGFLKRIRNSIKALSSSSVDLNDEELREWLGISNTNDKEITCVTCLKMLSETMGKIPLKYYQDTNEGRIRAKPDETTYALCVRPNKFMTPTTFWGSVELNRNLFGNAYVLMIKKDVKAGRYNIGQEVSELWLLRSDKTTVLIDNAGIFNNKGDMYYMYSDEYSGRTYFYRSDEIMHFKSSYTVNGVIGKSIIEILKDTIDGAEESQKFMNNLYKEGLTASMAMQYTGDLDDKTIKKLQSKYSKYLTGSNNAGKIVPVPVGLKLEPLNVSLVNAQFFELKKYTALQIAGALGIKPNQINNYEKSSYSNSETQNLSFLVDTMLYILKQYEEEINYKAVDYSKALDGYLYKYNEKSMLRTDSKSQMDNLTKAVNNGVYTPNEAREYLDKPKVAGGDVPIVNGNYIPLTDVGKQYNKNKQGSDNNA